ncbi:hypothetical protein TEA_027433 [Camellia sinensis var. sinensis]|uniref:Biotin carboxyl carrier protein of acetyl-CoA carboxylase n=1 Tax=Camellia sinensis var. sinensis TaxID=542762 RepID=A0A4V3WQA7_CAMSN|nr:hypothetical protein TEA_027433 [Camellia sinensis var. sinensis]
MDSLLEPSVAFKVAVDESSNAASTPTKSEVPAAEPKDAKPSSETSPAALASEESISEFISQVANLVKLVDSRDIMELQLKQFDCELLIRKKEAMPQPTSSAPVDIMHSPPSPAAAPPTFQLPPSTAAPSAPTPSAPSVSPSPPAAKSAKSSLPPLKCPMAGTFYRSPAPGEPPLVKVGDKVQKGQVLCIIEAMKLMNEIEDVDWILGFLGVLLERHLINAVSDRNSIVQPVVVPPGSFNQSGFGPIKCSVGRQSLGSSSAQILNQSGAQAPPTCWVCNQPGHIRRFCTQLGASLGVLQPSQAWYHSARQEQYRFGDQTGQVSRASVESSSQAPVGGNSQLLQIWPARAHH